MIVWDYVNWYLRENCKNYHHEEREEFVSSLRFFERMSPQVGKRKERKWKSCKQNEEIPKLIDKNMGIFIRKACNNNAQNDWRNPKEYHIKANRSKPIWNFFHSHHKWKILKLHFLFSDNTSTKRWCVKTICDSHEINKCIEFWPCSEIGSL